MKDVQRRAKRTDGRSRRRGAAVRRLELLEDRVVLNATISIDADGLLSVYNPSTGMPHIEVSVSDGEYLLTTGRNVGQSFDLASNAAGLAVTGDGTTEFRVRGITGLAFDTITSTFFQVYSSEVPIRFDIRAWSSQVVLGGGHGSTGLKDVTAPVVVEMARREWRDSSIGVWLVLLDSGSSEAADYTITADAVAATGGFGGVSFARINHLEIEGPQAQDGTTRFDVRSTHAGTTSLKARGSQSTVFDVDADVAPDDRPPLPPWDTTGETTGSLFLSGGVQATYNIKRTPTPVSIAPTGLDHVVNLTRDGSTAEIRHDVSIGWYDRAWGLSYPWSARVVIDDSAGAVARDASFFTRPYNPFSTWPIPGLSTFTGVAGEGVRVSLAHGFEGDVVYKAPEGLGNTLAIDFSGINPLPMGSGRLIYDGGSTGEEAPASRLSLTRRPWPPHPVYPDASPIGVDPFYSEQHFATGPGSGRIRLAVDYLHTAWGNLEYDGLSLGGVLDLLPATDYFFSYQGTTDPGVAVQAGATTDDGEGTLLIASAAASPAFVATTIANKTNVVVATNGTGLLATKIDYAGSTPVAGLESLTIVTSPNDAVDAVATPPGASLAVERTAEPRPVVVAPPPESTTTEPPPGPVAEPTPEPAPVPAPAPAPEPVPVPAEPPAQDVGAEFVARFGSAMRRGDADRPPSRAWSRLQAVRASRLAALWARRAERLQLIWEQTTRRDG